jgi:hypothetical protein
MDYESDLIELTTISDHLLYTFHIHRILQYAAKLTVQSRTSIHALLKPVILL